MTKTYILPISNPLTTLENVGGKGMSLSKLIAAGIPVPDGFHVTTDAYRQYVKDNGIGPQITAMLEVADPNNIARLETASEKIAGAFAMGKILQELEKAILSAYTLMKGVPVAVRSSGTAEDLPEASFADPMRKKPALTKDQIISLATLGQRIEGHYGMPMDVEWAMEKGKFYIVQARPITVFPPEWTPLEKDVYYTEGNLAEHLPNPVTPLFATLGLECANKAGKVLWSHMFGKRYLLICQIVLH